MEFSVAVSGGSSREELATPRRALAVASLVLHLGEQLTGFPIDEVFLPRHIKGPNSAHKTQNSYQNINLFI